MCMNARDALYRPINLHIHSQKKTHNSASDIVFRVISARIGYQGASKAQKSLSVDLATHEKVTASF